MTDFDEFYDRSGSASEKWNKKALKKHFNNENVLPFWVADMDFQASPQIINSLIQRAQNGIFGYEYKLDSLYTENYPKSLFSLNACIFI
jgi:cysteine-S-conjugate beta-lyase